jgi:hypothetical protein
VSSLATAAIPWPDLLNRALQQHQAGQFEAAARL